MHLLTKTKKQLFFTAAVWTAAVLVSCQTGSQKETSLAAEGATYPDLPGFFQEEIKNLDASNPLVDKLVQKDSLDERKSLHIDSWDTELAAFVAVDLNKPAYNGIIQTDTLDNGVYQYHFTDPKADLSCVQIALEPGTDSLKMVSIERKVDNRLYTTTELLVYEKGQYYLVEKNQDVQLMGKNFYRIEGRFLPKAKEN